VKRALITGITGQDGQHLTRLLLEQGYRVFGLINGQKNQGSQSVHQRFPEVQLLRGDLTDYASIFSAIQAAEPNEIYNLGARSHVGLSFSQPELTANVTGLGILRILESCRSLGMTNSVKIYQASSSEMFGKVRETPQNELTPFYPRSPYGVAKTFAHYTAVNYREAYGMYIATGILFNHEGEFRSPEFVTRKITHTVARIRLGLATELSLGPLEPKRDWGYAGDYVDAMWRIMQLDQPDDFVIATGETHSVREFLDEAFVAAGMGGRVEEFLEFDPSLVRPAEVELLVGDATKAKRVLGWTPRTSFSELVHLMVRNDLIEQAVEHSLEIPKVPATI
jgi:GDPmannose 4,6-dehydratase